ncbi:MAG: beta-glycosidase [Bacteroidales bacterium]|jgi:glucosylceramidase|nr:beta-glycosidase [Bacteroidales bacterium]
MKRILFFVFCVLLLASCGRNKVVQWVVTTPDALWQMQNTDEIAFAEDCRAGENYSTDVEIFTDSTLQTINGFGACFNELGWTSLSLLDEDKREEIFEELFTANGANFTVCRMPLGANDFSRDWYSYNEVDGDFAMQNFSIENDRETLIPFIRQAQKYNPDLILWASPWSPPAWMKDNKHYACAPLSNFFDQRYITDIKPEQYRYEGYNMFIAQTEYLKAYALYFKKFIEAYRAENINISMVMPQNEFNSCQPFPSCTWQAATLAEFTGKYLVPAMKNIGVEVMFGTMERPNPALVDTVLMSEGCGYISGVGFQWAGKESLPSIHTRYPNLKIYQTEQECGDGLNNWEGCAYSWDLMKYYFENGTNVYNYWNISLLDGGMSRWGWTQNSLVTVNEDDKTFRYTYEYYLLKHFSHYVLPEAKMLKTKGAFDNILAFKNKNGKIAVLLRNNTGSDITKTVKIGKKVFEINIKSQSINTILL